MFTETCFNLPPSSHALRWAEEVSDLRAALARAEGRLKYWESVTHEGGAARAMLGSDQQLDNLGAVKP